MILWGGQFDYNDLTSQLKNLKNKSEDPNVWSSDEAKNLFQNIKILENKIEDFKNLEKSLTSHEEFYKLLLAEPDELLIKDLYKETKITLEESIRIRYLNLR